MEKWRGGELGEYGHQRILANGLVKVMWTHGGLRQTYLAKVSVSSKA